MAKLVWGDKPPWYDLGIDRGVLYLDGTAVPWNGLMAVDEKAVGEITTDHYFDGVRTHITQHQGEFGATIKAFTYPDVFAEYNGFGEFEMFKRFGFSYRTQLGLDHDQLHLVYNVLVQDTDRAWTTVNARDEPSHFSWDISGEPVKVPNARPSAHLKFEFPQGSALLGVIEDILYGTDTSEPRMPTPEELVEFYEAASILRVTVFPDGSYEATGPDEMVMYLDNGRIRFNSPSLMMIDPDRFVLHSY